jgi:hypothetical protein
MYNSLLPLSISYVHVMFVLRALLSIQVLFITWYTYPIFSVRVFSLSLRSVTLRCPDSLIFFIGFSPPDSSLLWFGGSRLKPWSSSVTVRRGHSAVSSMWPHTHVLFLNARAIESTLFPSTLAVPRELERSGSRALTVTRGGGVLLLGCGRTIAWRHCNVWSTVRLLEASPDLWRRCTGSTDLLQRRLGEIWSDLVKKEVKSQKRKEKMVVLICWLVCGFFSLPFCLWRHSKKTLLLLLALLISLRSRRRPLLLILHSPSTCNLWFLQAMS